MSVLIAPPPTGSYRHLVPVRLGEQQYRLFWHWDDRAGFWLLDVSVQNETVMLNGPLVVTADVLAPVRWHDLCPAGTLQVTSPARIPGLTSFREGAELRYVG